jgi:DNA polymerase-3 subunit gamma/tau
MAYEPLHHKYRPKSFAELVGQEAIATTLTNAIRTAKIAPAYLFTGPRGTGKTSSARILAKSLNCLNSTQPTAEPCGVCDVCQGITKGYSLDVIEIDAASNTGVDNIRELIEKAQFAPVQCRYKVYVIDECHMLSTAAFNALLKTLEEPPKHVVFVLATTDPQRVLPTIISRCQRFDFRRIQLESMVKHLSAIASQENIHISSEAVTLIAQIAQGGLRDAESLLDQLALLAGEITPDKVWNLVGSVSEQDLLALLKAIAQNQPEAVLDCIRKILDSGREPLIILQNLAACYRDLLIAKTAPNRQDLVTCTQQTWIALVEFAQRLEMSIILQGQQHLRTAEVQIKNTTQPRLWLEVTLLGLLPSANIQSQTVSTPERVNPPVIATTDHPVTPPVPQTTNQNPAVHPATITPEPFTAPPTIEISKPSSDQEVERPSECDLTQVWQQVLVNIHKPSRKALLGQMCQIIEFNGNLARIAVKGTWLDALKSDLPMIKAAFKQIFQREIEVYLEKGTDSTTNSTKTNPEPKNYTPVQQARVPKYNQLVSDRPLPPATPKPAPPKTESTTAAPQVQTLSTPQIPTPLADWAPDEVESAAQRLAQFFDGQIIRVTGDALDSPVTMTTSDWMDESEFEDD